ncbi:MAG: hypothetical protein J3K34DRAFT_424062 [Monoraphidium minutum]|nr:MAG: hypothetical protein J3K34DRAFT_424062 [Monoraphidium minutum]
MKRAPCKSAAAEMRGRENMYKSCNGGWARDGRLQEGESIHKACGLGKRRKAVGDGTVNGCRRRNRRAIAPADGAVTPARRAAPRKRPRPRAARHGGRWAAGTDGAHYTHTRGTRPQAAPRSRQSARAPPVPVAAGQLLRMATSKRPPRQAPPLCAAPAPEQTSRGWTQKTRGQKGRARPLSRARGIPHRSVKEC